MTSIAINLDLQLKWLSWQDEDGDHELYGNWYGGWYIDLSCVPYDGLLVR